jgi:hypothetical protein
MSTAAPYRPSVPLVRPALAPFAKERASPHGQSKGPAAFERLDLPPPPPGIIVPPENLAIQARVVG